MVAGFVNESLGFGDVALGEVVVGEVESHAGARGDGVDLFEVVRSAAGEEGVGEELKRAGAAEVVDRLVEVRGGFGGAAGVGAAEGEVIEANAEQSELPLDPFQSLGGAAEDLRRLALGEQEIAV